MCIRDRRNWRGSTATGGVCGLIGFNAGKLTSIDGQMKANLTSLLDCSRGRAWPPSVRTVRRSVKSDNERDPHPYLPAASPDVAHYRETAVDKADEGEGNGRSV